MPCLRRLAALLAFTAALAGCRSIAVPVLESLRGADPKIPVVLVPGVTGTRLAEPATGRVVWGNGRSIFAPHDGGYAVARSVVPGASAGALAIGPVIEHVRFLLLGKAVYSPMVRLFERNGYRYGDLEAPRAGDGFFLFGYDWRQENAVSARRLADALDRLRRVRGERVLPVALICQSNGAHVCRWLAKYGGASLDDAAAGRARRPETIDVRRLILVATANGGSVRNLRWLHRGRRYFPLVGRYWRPETVFTFASIYEDLPADRDDLFVDPAGEALAVDLYDVEAWRRYGWSVFDHRVARRLGRGERPELFGDAAARRAFLGLRLARARLFQETLRRDAPGAGPRYYLVQNVGSRTPARAVLAREGDGWRTGFAGDRWVERRAGLARLTTAPGDGHATRRSQLWLADGELASLAAEPYYIDGRHFELILDPAVQARLLSYLDGSSVSGSAALGSS